MTMIPAARRKVPLHVQIVTVGKTVDGQSRLNVENRNRLAGAGFLPGARFRVESDTDRIVLSLDPRGTHQISPKEFPLRSGSIALGSRLDLRNDLVGSLFSRYGRAQVAYLRRRLVIGRTPVDENATGRYRRLLSRARGGRLKLGSLYSGIGTLDRAAHRGLTRSGLREPRMGLSNELVDRYVEAALSDNHSHRGAMTWSGGIEQLVATSIRLPQDLDMLVLGIPCKGASLLNIETRDNPESHGAAGHQILNFVMALRALAFAPSVILIENVVPWSQTMSCAMVRRVLEEQGYATRLVGDVQDGKYEGLDSHPFGDIESRRRMALLAHPPEMTPYLDRFTLMPEIGGRRTRVGDIRDPETMVPPAEYGYGTRLERADRKEKGWRPRIASDADIRTGSLSAAVWKQRSEDPRFRNPANPTETRVPSPDEHARLKGQPLSLIRSLPEKTAAHMALGNGCCRRVWEEFFKWVGKGILEASAGTERADRPKPRRMGQLDLFGV